MTLLLARFAVSDRFHNGFSCADFDVVLRGHGDKKELSVSGTSLTIQPSGYNQIWTAFCNVSIDFNVPGTPSLPVSLTAPIVFESSGPGGSTVLKRTVEFFRTRAVRWMQYVSS